ncbi:hypothetical protein NDU88_001806 [Pleurodeles waltl]|uniref:Uncharacterized protein n=1 Tax=Pleurodeles waltl TaxID=8319 RepID=A0AAV7V9D6_PLEWA|nr:hypothetical protein NDU88_001806 [Pleurodeles waltl]
MQRPLEPPNKRPPGEACAALTEGPSRGHQTRPRSRQTGLRGDKGSDRPSARLSVRPDAPPLPRKGDQQGEKAR